LVRPAESGDTVGFDLRLDTPQGRLRGVVEHGVAVFKGIPYAQPPLGERRFQPPVQASAWEGVRDGTRYGPTAPRTGYPPPFDAMFDEPMIEGDDCLSLNVWTPHPVRARMSVMVWIHGGAFRNGTSAAPGYDGSAFARSGVVLVSINYRLGVDGFLFLEGRAPNRGLLDQIAALEWVRSNIEAFGGDPDNVTVFGQSAGGMSVCALMTMPSARGLFHRAIAQSGGGHHALAPEDARRVTAAVARAAGVSADPAGLAGADLGVLAQAQGKVSLDVTMNPDPGRWGRLAYDAMPFEPTIDGDVLPALPIETIEAGVSADVPLLTGTTSQEWRLFLVPTRAIDAITDLHLQLALSAYALPADAWSLYRDRAGSAGERLCDLVTDWFLTVPAIRLAERRPRSPTFVYRFAWSSPQYDGRLGACHALELPFVFDTRDTRSAHALAGPNPPSSLARAMHDAWVSFARTGDPGWEPYETDRRAVMVFDERSEVRPDPDGDRRAVWDGIR
jgi:para-nitrobenzyl esterase